MMRMPHRSDLTKRVGVTIAKFTLSLSLTLFGFGCVGPNKSLYPPRSGEPARTVYVINHSILHTGVAVQRSDIPPGIWPAGRDYDGFRYLEVGWGEDDGYRKPLSPRTAFHALRGSTKTVLLCGGFDQPSNRGRAVIAIDLSQRGFDRLCQHIARTYALDESGRPILLEKDWYRARGRYSGFHNCNTWIAAGLRAAGCPINPTISITPRPLLLQVRQFGRDIAKTKG
ncbi:MAG: hypothetical protein DLM52_02735 [Chthoniobacterales bacterium]|nr:MAG: hypothetical protein DLM52_02735 [Chthoniobacterales bacterium]